MATGTSPTQYQQTAGYPGAYVQPPQVSPQQTVPQLAQPRPRAGTSTRPSRPASFHEYPTSVPYSGGQSGPQPAQQGYTPQQVAAWQSYWRQMHLQGQRQQQQQQQTYQNAMFGTTSANQPPYTPLSPINTSPTFPTRMPTAQPNANFSTRMAAAAAATTRPSYATADVRYAPPLSRTMSARGPQGRTSTMPGSWVESTSPMYSEDSASESSESEYYDDEEEEERRRRFSRARDSRLMSSSSQRRPSLPKSYTSAPAVPTRSSREVLHRNQRSDNGIDYHSSSDNVDSDRTARAVVDHGRARTHVSTSTRSSRRPSLSTNASSGRTRLTNLSSVTSGMASMTMSGRHRDINYFSKRDQDDILRRREEERQREIEDYQDQMRGEVKEELTAEKISRLSETMRRIPSASGRSHRSHRSSKSRVVQGDALEIKSGNTIINVPGDSSVSFRTGEDGSRRIIIEDAGTARSVVSGAGGKGKEREREYVGSSKSSSSRVGRSRGGSEVDARRGRKRDSIQEEKEGEGAE